MACFPYGSLSRLKRFLIPINLRRIFFDEAAYKRNEIFYLTRSVFIILPVGCVVAYIEPGGYALLIKLRVCACLCKVLVQPFSRSSSYRPVQLPRHAFCIIASGELQGCSLPTQRLDLCIRFLRDGQPFPCNRQRGLHV